MMIASLILNDKFSQRCKPFKTKVHTSDLGAKAVLLQDDDDHISYWKFIKHLIRYLTAEKETMAFALQQLEVYVGSTS